MLKDCRGNIVQAGDRILMTQFKQLKVVTLVKETPNSFIFTSEASKVIIPKYQSKYVSYKNRNGNTSKGWQTVDISEEPYLYILRVSEDFIL